MPVRSIRWGPAVTAAVAALASLVGTPAPAGAASTGWGAPGTRVDLKVLVVDDGGVSVSAIRTALQREGVPSVTVRLDDPARPQLIGSFLSDTVSTGPRAKFQAVVLPDKSAQGLSDAEIGALHDLGTRFGVRQLTAYTWAHPGVGLRYAENPGYVGTLDGMTATVTPAGSSAFGYLRGSVPLDDVDAKVSESYGYLALPQSPTAERSFQPMLTAPIPGSGGQAGSLLGVLRDGGREEMVATFNYGPDQQHFLLLSHGIVTWLTRGVHLGTFRQYFSVHVDDVFMSDNRWHTGLNCTVGADCTAQTDANIDAFARPVRMTAADAGYLDTWQQSRGFYLDLAYNGYGSDQLTASGARDPLTDALVGRHPRYRWLNHTYTHRNLGCVQDHSVTPWRCVKDASGAVQWRSKATIQDEISRNVAWAWRRGIKVDYRDLVTGEHSGLRTSPQMPVDNPNLGPAMTAVGVAIVASDASRERTSRTIGTTRTIPRHPMNIFYNVGTAAEEVDEYNWLYTRRADGGSGACEDNPTTTTCIAPLDPVTGFRSHIVPQETRIALRHVLAGDPRPHYAHQSNVAEDRILYPVVDAVLSAHRGLFAANTPIVNLRQLDASTAQNHQQTWQARQGSVMAYLLGGVVTVTNTGSSALAVPFTAPAGTVTSSGATFGSAYAGERSASARIAAGGSLALRLPAS